MNEVISEKRKSHEKEDVWEESPSQLPWVFRKRGGFVPWLMVIVLLVCVGLLFTSNWRAQKEMKDQLERQNLVIDSLKEKQAEDDTSKSIPKITSETLKSELGTLQELVTQEYIYTNADKREQDAKWIFGWSRPFSNSSLLLTYDGTIKAGIDMSKIEVEVNEEGRVIKITLPESRITDNIIPQESITILEVKDGLFNEITLDDYNAFISEQKTIMEQKAVERGLLEKADGEARKAVRAFLSLLPGMEGENAYRLEIN